MSLIFDDVADVLRARLTSAVASVEPTFFFSYGDDVTPNLLGKNKGDLNGVTNVELVGGPPAGYARVIKSGFIYNGDTAPVEVIVEHYDGATARPLAKRTLAPNETMTFGVNGFSGGSLTAAAAAYDWSFALGDETTAITTGTKVTWRAPRPFTLSDVPASLTTAGTGSSGFDVKVNGVSIFSTAPTIDANEKTTKTATVPAVLATTDIAEDDEFVFIVTTAGTAAAGAKMTLKGIA